jgi:hypothetical protein
MSQYLIWAFHIPVIIYECERKRFEGQFSFPVLKVITRKFPKKIHHGFLVAIWVESKED